MGFAYDTWGGSWGSSWANSWGQQQAPQPAERRGGAFYPTPEELRELRRAERRRRKREQDEAALLDATLRDVHERVAEPEVYAARMAAIAEMEDEEDMLRLLVALAHKVR